MDLETIAKSMASTIDASSIAHNWESGFKEMLEASHKLYSLVHKHGHCQHDLKHCPVCDPLGQAARTQQKSGANCPQADRWGAGVSVNEGGRQENWDPYT
jgi:hypothetical protein